MAHQPYDLVTVDPAVLNGQPCITGTRIPVSLIGDCVAAGMSEAEIRAEYPSLPDSAIQATIAYLWHLPDDWDNEKQALELLDLVTVDPTVLDGEPCITGTRIPVTLIVDRIADGMSQAEIHAKYPSLPNRAVDAAIGYLWLLALEQADEILTSRL